MQKYTKENLAYETSTLKRFVYFENYIQVYLNLSQVTMGTTHALLDISDYVSARAEVGIFQILIDPNATAYWEGALSSDGVFNSSTSHLLTYGVQINRLVVNMGFAKLTSEQKIYYLFRKVTGGGTATTIIRLYGYIEPK